MLSLHAAPRTGERAISACDELVRQPQRADGLTMVVVVGDAEETKEAFVPAPAMVSVEPLIEPEPEATLNVTGLPDPPPVAVSVADPPT